MQTETFHLTQLIIFLSLSRR